MAPFVKLPLTFQLTVSSSSPTAVVCQQACKRVRFRELVTDNPPVAYTVQAPLSTSPTYPKAPGEETVFQAYDGQEFPYNQTICYLEAATGSPVFSVSFEN